MKINPFVPNSPVNSGMFVGRLVEIVTLEKALVQARAGNPNHIMITGERGIGKTSLQLYLKVLAKGDISLSSDKYNFLVLDLDINHNTTQIGLIQRINSQIEIQLGHIEPLQDKLRKIWDFVQRIRIMDSGINPNNHVEIPEEVIIDKLAYVFVELCEKICSVGSDHNSSKKYDGILLLIDEADNCSTNLKLGSFLKLFTEKLQKNNCNKVMICLAGMPELYSKLYESHPSSLRIFDQIKLGRLTGEEILKVISICIEKANRENKEKTSITEEAKSLLVSFSEGFPHFIQQFGYSAFDYDKDGIICDKDVLSSAAAPNGSISKIGDRYYRNDFYNKIQKESYRQVLRIMADVYDQWISKSEIKTKFRGKKTTLDNAIKALRDRHIILSKEGEKGVYRLQHQGFALWIKLFTEQSSHNMNGK